MAERIAGSDADLKEVGIAPVLKTLPARHTNCEGQTVTNKPVRILGIAGSLRRESYNRATLRAAAGLLPEGVVFDTFELDDIPVFNQDEDQDPPAVVVDLKRRIRQADAVLFVTPEYNYSIPGVLKNAIDWASRPYGDSAWDQKPAAIMGASVGLFGTVRAQYHLRQILVFLNMFPINQPEVMIGNAGARFDESGNLTDQATKDQIRRLLQNLADWTTRIGNSGTA
jgi:chromate reductase